MIDKMIFGLGARQMNENVVDLLAVIVVYAIVDNGDGF